MTEDWTDEARRRLLDLRRGPGAWGYRPRSGTAVEPSALAALALLAVDGGARPVRSGGGRGEGPLGSTETRPGRPSGPSAMRRRLVPGPSPDAPLAAARWLASARRPDGSTGVGPGLPEPGWPTPLAMLLWAEAGGFEAERSAALGWLLKLEGRTYRRPEGDPLGHDTTIVGWPWVAGTHSWVEPTALALLALGREGRAGHPRAVEGARLLVDRAIPGGGWNLGNPVVFGTPLRPLPGPSGLALLGLAAGRGMGHSASPLPEGEGGGKNPSPRPSPTRGEGDKGNPSEVIAPAVAYLRSALAETLAPVSLGWGLLGLRAWGAWPPEGPRWLASAFDRASKREPGPVELAMLLLAAAPRSLEVLGIADRSEAARHA